MEVIDSKEKPKKTRPSTEDKLKVLLDEQFNRIEEMVDAKLEKTQYRIYKSFMIELNRAILRR
ncbi:hypothetical protein Dhaf_1446 [Desulfitobacterium hafniense DCB-2]|uniref:Uncharacterized protein n=1 Tax=Desulfitobacterium hafniense (strain DSM 10664 / DCB-2) TaxID=272564 RepID=B8FNX4_DESHD|nr:hypothetical protein [Desulfitobacterium hafniense]ACL19499.1 hypothetical protein Dhaf_1446 [Desulfitobacterium hafniense DCB-2]